MTWQYLVANWICLPRHPIGIIHFLGGAFVGAAPQLAYGKLLEALVDKGFAVIATPFINTFDHGAIAETALNQFEDCVESLYEQRRLKIGLPIYGLGHSMGCKLHLLICSLFEVQRAGNIFLAFNNFAVDQAIPFAPLLQQNFSVEFTPSPQKTFQLIQRYYQAPRNLSIQFQNDDLDQTRQLVQVLESVLPSRITYQKLRGNHLTPLGQDIRWQNQDSFSPLDAVGQWMKQSIYQDLSVLEQTIIHWLNPLSALPKGRF
jgi:hypothetical protein